MSGSVDPRVLERVAEARARDVPVSTASPDDEALVGGQVDAWLTDLDDALARLLVSGLAHPDPELPATLGLLAERAERLGAVTAVRGLGALAVWTDALRPGPPDRASRTLLARHAFDELMRITVWMRMFRADIGLSASGVQARGVHDEARQDDSARASGRVWLDGMTLNEHGVLGLVGHTDDDRAVILLDPLADPRREDLFGAPVISRLFQDLVDLAELGASILELDRHPVDARGDTWILRPAFRAIPRRIPADGEGPRTRHVSVVDARVRVRSGEVALTDLLGGALTVGRTFRYNLLKRLANEGVTETGIPLVAQRRREGPVVLAAREDGGRTFPTVDARAWRVDPDVLGRAGEDSGDLSIRASTSLFGGLSHDARATLFRDVLACRPTGANVWRLAWWSARVGLEPPRGDPGSDGLSAVWMACWDANRAALDALWTRYANLPAPGLRDVAARALLLDAVRQDRSAALDYLDAHRVEVVRAMKASAELPNALDLLALADARAWLRGDDRAGFVVDALGVPSEGLRERAAWALASWRSGGGGPVGDELALAASSSWGVTLVG